MCYSGIVCVEVRLHKTSAAELKDIHDELVLVLGELRDTFLLYLVCLSECGK